MKITKQSAIGFFATIVFMMSGCASDTNKKLDNKVTQENEIKNKNDLQNEAEVEINSNSNLNSNQKNELNTLRTSTRGKLDDLREQSLKLRAILIQDIVSSNYNQDEVDLIKKRLKKVEDQRLSVMFEAVDKANKILGRQAVNYPHLMDVYLEQGRGSRD